MQKRRLIFPAVELRRPLQFRLDHWLHRHLLHHFFNPPHRNRRAGEILRRPTLDDRPQLGFERPEELRAALELVIW